MNTKHAKSLCCQAQIRRFGHRRRQCIHCKKTWSIRPKKRGRPVIRISPKVMNQIFLKGYTLQQLAHRRPRVGLLNFRHRFRQALNCFVARPCSQKIPFGPLTLLADGLYFLFHKKPWVLYLTALKSCRGKTAIFLDPVLLPGKEGAARWRQVFSTIPPKARSRIKALVADNLNGMKHIAKHENWLLQLCHFHLILKFQIQYRRGRRALRGGKVRDEIYRLIRQILETSEESVFNYSLDRLTRIVQMSCGTQRIQATVRDFLQSVPYFRTYRVNPELNLPTTTNTVESMCGIIRDLLRRNRCASSPRSLLKWTTALIRQRQKLTRSGFISCCK